MRFYVLTCYFRHLKDIFAEAGIEVTNENRKDVDKAVHSMVKIDYKNCAAVWREIKKRIKENEEGFIAQLRETWTKQCCDFILLYR